MHLAPETIDPVVVAASSVVAAGAVAIAASRVRADATPARVGIAGAIGGAMLVAHMVEFPVVGGGSGHVLAAALAAVLVGWRLAVLVGAAVLGFQALVLGDGTIAALGLNVINMAIVAVLVAAAVNWAARRSATTVPRQALVGAVAAVASVAAARVAIGLESWTGLAASPSDMATGAAGIATVMLVEALVTGGLVAGLAGAQRQTVAAARAARRAEADGHRTHAVVA